MTPLPPPQGMSEDDYGAIEAAVTETVRGRWFLGEFARRNRAAELGQILDAVSRLEGAVANGQSALAPPADPSIRLLMQRIKEIAGQLDHLSVDMREAGIDPRFVGGVEHQARAVAGMMRTPARSVPPPRPDAMAPQTIEAKVAPPQTPVAAPRMPRADLPPILTRSPQPREVLDEDPRALALNMSPLSALDTLPLSQKLALFS